jgi:hypothetical protein
MTNIDILQASNLSSNKVSSYVPKAILLRARWKPTIQNHHAKLRQLSQTIRSAFFISDGTAVLPLKL